MILDPYGMNFDAVNVLVWPITFYLDPDQHTVHNEGKEERIHRFKNVSFINTQTFKKKLKKIKPELGFLLLFAKICLKIL